jgi:hypothetical protein
LQDKKHFIILIIVFIIIGNSVFYLFDKFKERKLNNEKSLIAKGVVDRRIKSGSGGKVIVVFYKVKNQSYSIIENDIYDFIEKGDTVLVKYSDDDPSISKVLNFCYMQKYKGKCAKQ